MIWNSDANANAKAVDRVFRRAPPGSLILALSLISNQLRKSIVISKIESRFPVLCWRTFVRQLRFGTKQLEASA